MNRQELMELFVNRIPGAKYASGKKVIVKRCNLCGDSDDMRKAHMYILFGDDRPIIYYCQKCKGTGLVTHNTLMEWGVYDSILSSGIGEYNKDKLSKSNNYKYIDKEIYHLENYICDSRLSREKLKYINDRLGTELTYNDLIDNKIILNLGDLLDHNKIYNYTRDPSIMKQLDENFIGFISHDNAFVNLRCLNEGRVSKSIDRRYINYNIFNKFNNTQRFYTIPTSINLNYNKRIKLHVAEGAFDILSIYYNLRNQEKHSIYTSIGGSGYLNLIKNFILNMQLIYLEVHVYLDNDIDTKIAYKIRDHLSIYNIPLYIHRNVMSGEKDFGVRKERITEKIIQLS